jgi:hypothetical protein
MQSHEFSNPGEKIVPWVDQGFRFLRRHAHRSGMGKCVKEKVGCVDYLSKQRKSIFTINPGEG